MRKDQHLDHKLISAAGLPLPAHAMQKLKHPQPHAARMASTQNLTGMCHAKLLRLGSRPLLLSAHFVPLKPEASAPSPTDFEHPREKRVSPMSGRPRPSPKP